MFLKLLSLSFIGLFVFTPVSAQNWTQLKTKKCEIDHPKEWNVKIEPGMGIHFAMYFNDNTSEFSNNINFMIQEDLKDLSFDSYVALSLQQIDKYFKNSKVLKSEYSGDGKTKYFDIEYTGEYNEKKLHWLQRMWFHKGKAYVLTFTATQKSYSSDIDVAKKVFQSIQIKGIH